MTEAKEPISLSERFRFGDPKWVRLIFLSFFLVLILVGYGAYLHQKNRAKADIQDHLKTIGQLKVNQVRKWLDERRCEILTLATGPKIALDIEQWQLTGNITPELKSWIEGRLARSCKYGNYREVAIIGLDGGVLLTGGGDIDPTCFEKSDLAFKAMQEGSVEFSPLYCLCDLPDNSIVINLIAPLIAEDKHGSRVVGAMVHCIDAKHHLYPLIQEWPTKSPSAEALLVRKDNGNVLFLNELRYRKGAGLTLQFPLDDEHMIAAKAGRGERGVVEGLDYRGIPVLGSINPVQGTPWLLISKIDQVEVYAPLVMYLRLYLGFVVGSAIITWLVMSNWLRGIKETNLRREHEASVKLIAELEYAQKERQELIEKLQQALSDIKTLRGLLPICASCKKIRDDKGAWKQLEQYVSEHSEATFSHGICPECLKKLYPTYAKDKQDRQEK